MGPRQQSCIYLFPCPCQHRLYITQSRTTTTTTTTHKGFGDAIRFCVFYDTLCTSSGRCNWMMRHGWHRGMRYGGGSAFGGNIAHCILYRRHFVFFIHQEIPEHASIEIVLFGSHGVHGDAGNIDSKYDEYDDNFRDDGYRCGQDNGTIRCLWYSRYVRIIYQHYTITVDPKSVSRYEYTNIEICRMGYT